jgi:predicted TPR repeat methyltransferase
MSTPASIDEVLRQAMIAHRAGDLAVAESGYRDVLSQRPTDTRALHFLGLLYFHQGDRERGIDHLVRSLEHEPTNARVWNALGGMLIAMGRRADAKAAYTQSIKVAPDVAEGWYNLAICLRDDGEFDASIEAFREALVRQADYFRAHEALAMLLYQLGRVPEAARVYSDWSARDPGNAKARHMAAATSGHNVPSRASDEYVRGLFDEAAAGFETNLERLDYRAPELIAAALIERTGEAQLTAVLDAGCGTGLCGPLIRKHCARLVGVDLSSRMIERARTRASYDELVAQELTAFLESRRGSFDAVISADTLVYFGALDPVLAAAHESLHGGGLLIFTLEALEAGVQADYRLEVHGRYAHGESYVRRALTNAQFRIESLTHETLRRERERDVRGWLVIARSASAQQL